MQVIADNIKANMAENNGKISFDFIENLAENAKIDFIQATSRTRICVLTIYSGHEVVGIAQVLDPANDVAEIGNKIAYERARDELWSVCGNIALAI